MCVYMYVYMYVLFIHSFMNHELIFTHYTLITHCHCYCMLVIYYCKLLYYIVIVFSTKVMVNTAAKKLLLI